MVATHLEHIFDFESTMAEVISQRPEWRFLEEKRHLKDVIRLLLREAQSYCPPQIRVQGFDTTTVKDALTLSWLSLMLSQELHHPPQTTKFNFVYVFLQTLNPTDAPLARMNERLAPDFLEQPFDTASVQQDVLLLSQALYRFQEQYIGWELPWYAGKPLLPFLNHQTPKLWIQRCTDLMSLIQEQDSMINIHTQHIPEQPFHRGTLKPLHKSHPLRKQAEAESKAHQMKLMSKQSEFHAARPALQTVINQARPWTRACQKLLVAMDHMEAAWDQGELLKTIEKFEEKIWLFEEAMHQEKILAQALKQELEQLHEHRTELPDAVRQVLDSLC